MKKLVIYHSENTQTHELLPNGGSRYLGGLVHGNSLHTRLLNEFLKGQILLGYRRYSHSTEFEPVSNTSEIKTWLSTNGLTDSHPLREQPDHYVINPLFSHGQNAIGQEQIFRSFPNQNRHLLHYESVYPSVYHNDEYDEEGNQVRVEGWYDDETKVLFHFLPAISLHHGNTQTELRYLELRKDTGQFIFWADDGGAVTNNYEFKFNGLVNKTMQPTSHRWPASGSDEDIKRLTPGRFAHLHIRYNPLPVSGSNEEGASGSSQDTPGIKMTQWRAESIGLTSEQAESQGITIVPSQLPTED